MEDEIRTIPKEKMNGIKAMSPFVIDKLMLFGLRLLNNKEGEESHEETEITKQL